jgi:hypothetical protein
MSRALQARLAKLERSHAPRPLSRVVVIPWREWPKTEEGTQAMHQAHPHGCLFIPSTMTPEEWEAVVPHQQARL